MMESSSSTTCVEYANSDKGVVGVDTTRNNKQDGMVDVEELLEFVFPKTLQHPLSTGRLYAFGMYGPLDDNAKLRAGCNGKRVVSAWEIDTMCLQFEREDILQVRRLTVYGASSRLVFLGGRGGGVDAAMFQTLSEPGGNRQHHCVILMVLR